ncbi:hypothetical protein JRO89_XS09G0174600 [Xanthoceras sorbifolium]|uniref:RNase H type-1 domain-containing protein n=1 Tax=Xanthoceras sorbifolium TaxID=99658 RepID=A0ABQ8HLM3_9ROSI|nr:hypothetical protein JRO89_XS09G0174600 [Xanthoceras sorbifolium]
MILNINLPSSGRADVLLWHYDKLGVYSVKSGYWLACDSLDRPSSSRFSESGSWWRFLWALHFPAKVKACKSLRAVCEDCNFLAFRPVLGAQPVLEFFLSCKVLNPVADFELLAIVWWQSWFRENMFSGVKPLRLAVDQGHAWRPPEDLVLKINCDAAVCLAENQVGIGPSLAEALAVCIGMKLAIENGLLPAMVKSDLIFVVNLILAGLPIRSEIGLIIDDILNLKATHDFSNILLAIFLPPLCVYIKFGIKLDFWKCLVLTLFGYVPGICFALYAITRDVAALHASVACKTRKGVSSYFNSAGPQCSLTEFQVPIEEINYARWPN